MLWKLLFFILAWPMISGLIGAAITSLLARAGAGPKSTSYVALLVTASLFWGWLHAWQIAMGRVHGWF